MMIQYVDISLEPSLEQIIDLLPTWLFISKSDINTKWFSWFTAQTHWASSIRLTFFNLTINCWYQNWFSLLPSQRNVDARENAFILELRLGIRNLWCVSCTSILYEQNADHFHPIVKDVWFTDFWLLELPPKKLLDYYFVSYNSVIFISTLLAVWTNFINYNSTGKANISWWCGHKWIGYTYRKLYRCGFGRTSSTSVIVCFERVPYCDSIDKSNECEQE